MPVHPKEEEAESNLTDKVAQMSKDSNASDHPLHTQGDDKDLASFEHHKANPGPVIAENLGEPASKEDLKKKAEELNKK